MKRLSRQSRSKKPDLPYLLCVDKEGYIGNALLPSLSQEYTVVFVSRHAPITRDNVKMLAYHSAMPKIPNLHYEKIIVVDDQTKRTRECLPIFLEKARKDETPLYVLSSMHCLSERFFIALISYANVKIIIPGDVFGSVFPPLYQLSERIEPYLRTAKTKGIIYLRGDGLQLLFPISFERMISELYRVFLMSDPAKITYLFAKEPVTMLSFGRALENIDPLLRLDYLKDIKKPREIPSFPHGNFAIDDPYAWIAQAREYLQNKTVESAPLVLEKPQRDRFPLFLLGVIALFMLFLPLMVTLVFSVTGVLAASHGVSLAEEGNVGKAKTFAHTSAVLFSLAKQSGDVFLFETSLIGKETIALPLTTKITAGHSLAVVFDELLSSYTTGLSVLQNKSSDPQKDINTVLHVLKHATGVVDNLQAEKALPSDISKKLHRFSFLFHFFSATSDVLPTLFGFDKKMTYLVLFQNNMELRPSGGFIGSYGIATVEKGKLLDFSIHDVYDADGQLRGHVEPPFPIRRFLPQVHWYLRDSGFSASFPNAGADAANFLDLETGQKVDGVIGIDVSVLQNILKATGPVYVSAYNKTVDNNNLFTMTEAFAEKDFFPGSTQKKDFLRALFGSLQLKLATHKVSYSQLIEAVGTSIAEKHILFSFAKPALQNVFTANGFSSSLWDSRTTDAAHIADFFGISEANLGVNKANYFLKRKITQEVTVTKQHTLSESVTIQYKNLSDAWPGGDYKNYLRLILPKNTTLKSIAIDGVPQTIIPAVTNYTFYERPGFVSPPGFEVSTEEEEGKALYGFLIDVPPQKNTTIHVTYEVALPVLDVNNTVAYSLTFFKQPGTDPYPYSLRIAVPYGMKEKTKDTSLSLHDGQGVWDGILTTDRDFALSLLQK